MELGSSWDLNISSLVLWSDYLLGLDISLVLGFWGDLLAPVDVWYDSQEAREMQANSESGFRNTALVTSGQLGLASIFVRHSAPAHSGHNLLL